MEAIFVSYRRSDSEGQTGRLFHNLVEVFGRGAVLMDVAGLEKGRDFRKSIEHRLETCHVMLAVVGRGWVSAKAEDGSRRLGDPRDLVRIEIAAALRRDIAVIPVLVGGASLPPASELPDNLKDLVFRDGVELTHARWDSDVQLLVDALRPHLATEAPSAESTSLLPHGATPPAAAFSSQGRAPIAMWAIAAAVFGMLGAGGWLAYHLPTGTRTADVAVTPRIAQRASASDGSAVNASDGSVVTVGPAADAGLGSFGLSVMPFDSAAPRGPVNQNAEAGTGGTAINASGRSQVHVGKP